MAFIEWTQDFSVDNNGEMDKQHQLLFKYVNEYYEALEQNKGQDALIKSLDDIIEYTVFHFKDEEAMMDKYQFPGAASHKLIHRKLESDVTSLRQNLAAGKDVAKDVKFFLKSWLTAHIKGIDVKYTSYVT